MYLETLLVRLRVIRRTVDRPNVARNPGCVNRRPDSTPATSQRTKRLLRPVTPHRYLPRQKRTLVPRELRFRCVLKTRLEPPPRRRPP